MTKPVITLTMETDNVYYCEQFTRLSVLNWFRFGASGQEALEQAAAVLREFSKFLCKQVNATVSSN